MDMMRATVKHRGTQEICTVMLPRGYFAQAKKVDEFQSRDRPWRLMMMCTERRLTRENKIPGNYFYADTGESFVGKRYTLPSLAGRTPAPEEGSYDQVWGGVVKEYVSVGTYLHDRALAANTNSEIEYLGTDYCGETPAQVEEREMARTRALQQQYAGGSGGLNYTVYRALQRTEVRYYLVNKNGLEYYMAFGARMYGEDIVSYLALTGTTDVPDAERTEPFGHGNVGNPNTEDVLWESQLRFDVAVKCSDASFDEFREMVHTFGQSIEFSPMLMAEMSAEAERLNRDEHARVRAEQEAQHRIMERFKAEAARRDADRARRQAQWDAQLEADRERRRSWDRKMDSDRRISHMWSDAIRGVDRYEHPYDGSTIEVELGHGDRAFYNPYEDVVLTADSDLNKPFGFEELRRKED